MPTLEKAVALFLVPLVVQAESHTSQSAVWVLLGQSTVIMGGMLQSDANVRCLFSPKLSSLLI